METMQYQLLLSIR